MRLSRLTTDGVTKTMALNGKDENFELIKLTHVDGTRLGLVMGSVGSEMFQPKPSELDRSIRRYKSARKRRMSYL